MSQIPKLKSMIQVKLLVTVIVSFALVACASVPLASKDAEVTAKQFSPLSSRGVLYIYRKEQFQGGGVIYPIIVNGRVVASLKSGSFVRIDVDAGGIQVASFTTTAQSSISLTLKPGDTKFVSTAYQVSAGTLLLGIPGSVVISETAPNVGRSDISPLALVVGQSQ